MTVYLVFAVAIVVSYYPFIPYFLFLCVVSASRIRSYAASVASFKDVYEEFEPHQHAFV